MTVDGRAPGETIWQVGAAATASRSRICAGCRSRATAPTAIAAPAWSRSRASACWPPRASASPTPGMKVHDRQRARQGVAQAGLRAAGRPTSPSAPRRTTRTRGSGTGPTGSRSSDSRFPQRARAGARPQPSGDGGASRRLHPVQALRARLPRGAGQRRDRHGLPRPRREDRVRPRRPDGRSRPASPAASACRPARPAR